MRRFAGEVFGDTLIWFAVLVVLISQARKNIAAQKAAYGNKVKFSLWELLSGSLLASLVGGLCVSIAVACLGITFYKIDIVVYSIFLTFFLLLLNPYSIGLAYTGGLISILVIVFYYIGNPGMTQGEGSLYNLVYNNFYRDISPLLALAGLIHIIEGLLIVLDGSRGALPAFLKKDNKILGVFVLNRMWIFPVIAFVLVNKSSMGSLQGIENTVNWPIFRPGISFENLKEYLNIFIPLLLISSYRTIAIVSSKSEITKRSAVRTAMFGLILLILSLASIKYDGVKVLAAVFAMAGHEILAFIEGKGELGGEPYLVEKDYGVVVVDTIPGGAAEQMGIMSGEIVTAINNVEIRRTEDIKEILKNLPNFIWVKLLNQKGGERILEHQNYREGVSSLGIITIPKNLKGVPVLRKRDGILKRFLDKLN